MPELRIGDVTIPWTVRFSAKAKRKRIVATPEGVEVVAPEGTPLDGDEGVNAFVHKKRRWLFDAVRQLEARHREELAQHYASGAKLQYRGRRLLLDIQVVDVDVDAYGNGDVEHVSVECRSRFHVRVPATIGKDDRGPAVRAALVVWMRERALRDAERWARTFAERLAVEPAGVRLGDQKSMWGSCGRDGVVRVNWRLVQAPAAAMEYVVAHEVVHLVERNHTARFWRLLGEVLPGWAERKALLERWEREQEGERREV